MGLLLIVALVAVNVLLIPIAFRHAAGTGGSGGAGSAGAGGRSRSPSPTPDSASAVPTAPSKAAAGDDAASPLLMSSQGKVVVRSTRGSCKGEPKASLQISADRGGSFKSVEPDPGVDEVLAVEVLEGGRVTVVAAGEDCKPQGYESTDRGATWKDVSTKGRWHLAVDPSARKVVSPDGPVQTPCAPAALSTERNDVVRLLCPGGRILRTLDDQTWDLAGRLDGATGIRFPVPSVGFAVAPAKASDKTCPAAVFRSTDSGRSWTRLTCLKGDAPRGIAGQDGQYVAQAGRVVEVSDDRGETWQRP